MNNKFCILYSGSQEITTGDLNYVKQESPVSYQFVQMDTDKVQLTATTAIPQQYYVIGNVSDYVIGNVTPLKIAPKTSTIGSSSSINSRNAIQQIGGSSSLMSTLPFVKKRDDRRRGIVYTKSKTKIY